MKSIVKLLLASLVFLSMTVHAKIPAQIAASYYNALQRGDYKAAVSYFDDSSVKDFREMMGFINEMPPKTTKVVYQAMFGEQATKASVAKMDDREFFAAFLEVFMSQAISRGAVSFDRLKILGQVFEGGNVVHLVVRNNITSFGVETESMEVISLKKYGKRWKVLMSGKIRGMAENVRNNLTNPRITSGSRNRPNTR